MLLRCLFYALLFACFSVFANPNDLFERLAEKARMGNAEAKYHLAMMHNNGIGTEKSAQRAFALFTEAAREGSALAHYKVGCYLNGQFGQLDGMTLDANKALEHKLVAAQAGYSLAQNDVAGLYYQRGDIDSAIKWIQRAAEQGMPRALASLIGVYMKPGSELENRSLAYTNILKLQKIMPGIAQLEAQLEKLAAGLTAAEIAQIEDEVAGWQPQPTALTQKAQLGISRARQVAESDAG
ncbi:tetratricopeptide repeat protein [Alteromonas gilva]|uniref:Tetratricopeptide repeat protein n=1 Tax=Alteromonas gilva TaxID=2987522 RepID=A0ABT5L072_9ALTE|nr:tetratricopeptide repeat protein [Alteromonas gilva]MDC8829901.1 tetratricopeptide repeat protein [Alteromonas gilva]